MYQEDQDLLDQIRHALMGEASRRITRGGGRTFDNNLTPVFDAQGRLESVIGIAVDVTEHQKIEADLRAERGLFVGGPVMVLRWRAIPPHWLVDYVSANVRTILGYAPEDLTSGRILFDTLVHPEDRERVHQEANQLKSKGILVYEQEYRMRVASGDTAGSMISRPPPPPMRIPLTIWATCWTSPIAGKPKRRSARPRSWKAWASLPAASPTTSITCSRWCWAT